MKLNNKRLGFTLVELIIAIVILIILAVIAFITIAGYGKDSRDSSRLTDIRTIRENIDIFLINKSSSPTPDNPTVFTYSGSIGFTQGIIGDNVFTNLGLLNKIPVDPSTGNKYTYSKTNASSEFQIGAIFEGESAFNNNIINTTYADSIAKPMIEGNFNSKFLKINSGSSVFVIALPSIITSDTSETDITNQINNQTIVHIGSNNIPASYNGGGFTLNGGSDFTPNRVLIFSGTTDDLSRPAVLRDFAYKLKQAYDGTSLENDVNFDEFLDIDFTNSPSNGETLLNNYIRNKVGGLFATNGNNYTVDVSNSPPIAPYISQLSGEVGVSFNSSLPAFVDVDLDILSYSISGLPSGLSFNSGSRLISGAPTTDGTFSITYQANDGNNPPVNTTFDIVIVSAGANNPPVAPLFSDLAGEVGVTFPNTVLSEFSDADGDSLTYSISGLPSGLVFDSLNRVISGTPTTAGTSTVTYTADDSINSPVDTQFDITIITAGGNNPPIAPSLPDLAGEVGVSYSGTLEVFIDTDTLSYSTSGLPDGLSFNSSTRVISGTPTSSGVFLVSYIADDGVNSPVSTNFNFTIVETGANVPPVAPLLSGLAGDIGASFFTILDPFTDVEGDSITYSMTDLPSGLTFSGTTREIEGIPTSTGTFLVSYGGNDGNNPTVYTTFTIDIFDNDPPIAPYISQLSGMVGTGFSEIVTPFTDYYILSYSMSGLPSGLSFNSGTLEISGTPTNTGTSSVTYTANDGYNPDVSTNFDIFIVASGSNLPPIAPSLNTLYGQAGISFSETLTGFTDPDLDILSYSIAGLPSGLSFNSGTLEISGTPDTIGTGSVTYTANDGFNSDVDVNFDIVITDTCQKAFFNDDNFKQCIADNIDGNGSPWSGITVNELLVYSGALNCSNENILNIDGLGQNGCLSNVTSIDLSDNTIGKIPSSIGTLSNLTILNFNNNNYSNYASYVNSTSYQFPAEIGTLINLTELLINNNGIFNRYLPNISGLNKLITLDASNNLMSGFPHGASSINTLESINLNNNILGDIGSYGESFLGLKYLYLNNNNLAKYCTSCTNWFFKDGPINLPAIEELHLSNNGINRISSSIGELNTLRVLTLDNNYMNKLYSPFHSNFKNLTNLITLNLESNINIGNLDYNFNQNSSVLSQTGILYNSSDTLYIEGNGTTIDIYTGSTSTCSKSSFTDTNFQQCIVDSVLGGGYSGFIWDDISYNDLINYTGSLLCYSESINNIEGIGENGCLQNISELDLYNNNISTVPSGLYKLTGMTYLGLGRNNISSISSDIGDLISLTELYLNTNNISSIPTEIGNLVNLTDLEIDENSISSIPTSIGNLINLTHLDLSQNNISGTIPSAIGNLTLLESLQLNNNSIDNLPTEFSYLNNLTSLRLYNNGSGLGNLRASYLISTSARSQSGIPTAGKQMTIEGNGSTIDITISGAGYGGSSGGGY